MSSARRIVGSIASLAVSQGVTMVTGLVGTVYLARVLGPEYFGILGFGSALISYFGLAAAMGTETFGMREIARSQGNAPVLAGRVVSLRLVLGGLVVVAFFGVLAGLNQPLTVKHVMAIQIFGVIVSALTLDFAYQGLERFGIKALRQSGAAILVMLGALILVSGQEDILIAATIPVAVVGLSAFMMLGHFIKTNGALPLKIEPRIWGGMMKASAPMAMAGFMSAIYFNLDIVMLGFLKGREEVGLYVAAYKVAIMALAGGEIIRSVFLPVLSKVHADKTQLARQGARLAAAVMFVGGPVAVGGILFSAEIINVLFGEPYQAARTALCLLMLGVLFVHIGMIYGTKLLSWNHERAQLAAMSVGAAGNLLLNFLLIPPYGIEGAAVATLASHGIVAGCMGFMLLRRGKPLSLVPLARASGATGLTALVLWLGGLPLLDLLGVESDLFRLICGGTLLLAIYAPLCLLMKSMEPRLFRMVPDGKGLAGEPREDA